MAALSPVTDLTLSGATYETRADADPYFTKQQVAELVQFLSGKRRRERSTGFTAPGAFRQGCLPSAFTSATTKCCSMTRDDTSSVPSPPASMPGLMCGWACHMDLSAIIGTIKASAQALDAIGMFLTDSLRGEN